MMVAPGSPGTRHLNVAGLSALHLPLPLFLSTPTDKVLHKVDGRYGELETLLAGEGRSPLLISV